MKIISIQQPWASLIVTGMKDVENRTWPTSYRGPVLIHASGRADSVTAAEIESTFGVRPPNLLRLGGVIGAVDVVDCVQGHASKWYAGTYLDKRNIKKLYWAHVYANPRPLPFVGCKGQLGIRDAPADLLAKLQL